jgi:hypothetical protein
MSALNVRTAAGSLFAFASLATMLALSGCASDGYGGSGVSTSVSVGYGYGGYYGPYYGGGYYAPYPPVVVVPPGERPDRPDGGNRPTTLPADVGGPSIKPSAKPSAAPSRPATASRPTSRPSPRPAPRPMPRGRR